MTEGSQELKIVPAEDIRFVGNCVVIPEGIKPDLVAIFRAAIDNNAFEDNGDEEAGDDECMVQFPGHKQEMLTIDGIRGRIREMLNL